MNTKKNGNFRGMGVYVVLVLAVVFIWYFLSQNTASNSYTKTDFEKALKDGDVINVEVVQNREIPTGSLTVSLKGDKREVLYVSDVNSIQDLMDEYDFTAHTCDDVPAENWIMTLLPYLLVFGAVFILFMIANNNAAAQGGGSKMMNLAKTGQSLPRRKTTRLHLMMWLV